MPSNLRTAVGGLALSALIGVTTGYLYGPRVAKRLILSGLRRQCPACRVEIGGLQIHWLTGGLTAGNVRYLGDPASGTVVDLEALEVTAVISPRSVWEGALDCERLALRSPHVTVSEQKDGPPSPSPEYPPAGYAMRGMPPLKIRRIDVHDGRFTYLLGVGARVARLEVSQIEGFSGSFATRESLLDPSWERHPIHLEAKAVFEHSGRVGLEVQVDPFAEKNRDTIEIDLQDMRLAETDPFFSVEDGIRLSGVLHHGHTRMVLAQGVMTLEMSVEYQDFAMHFVPTPERGKVVSWIVGAIESLKVTRTRPRDGAPGKDTPQTRITLKREPHMKIFPWLLKGLRTAAEQIISS